MPATANGYPLGSRFDLAHLEAGPRLPDKTTPGSFTREMFAIAYKAALSSAFPVFIMLALAATQIYRLPLLSRYDQLFLLCLGMQLLMIRHGFESRRDLPVLAAFHLLGLGLETYKVANGSWSYRESAIFVLCGVPLYSGFMYGSVASFFCQCWRHFRISVSGWPKPQLSIPFAAVLYGNFFWNSVLDLRYALVVLFFVVFARTRIDFETDGKRRKVPVVLLIPGLGFLLWVAENIATGLGAWSYPYQESAWQPVRPYIIVSWTLLIAVVVILLVVIKSARAK